MSNLIIAGGWKKVDPDKEQHLGHIFEKDGKRAHDKRCDYCGRWMTYDIKNIHEWGSNAKMGLNDWPEKVHCGSEHCQEYHYRVIRHEEKVKAQAKAAMDRIFLSMKKQGVVS